MTTTAPPFGDRTTSASTPQPLWRYWTTEPKGPWQAIQDTAQARAQAIASGARFFTVLGLDQPVEEGREPRYLGPLYAEFDAEKLSHAHSDCIAFLRLLESIGVNLGYVRLFASGQKGFHLEVPETLLGIREPLPGLPYVFRELVRELTSGHELPTLDWTVYSGGKGRMWRIPNLRRPNGRYKVPLTAAEVLHLATEEIEALTVAPRDVHWPEEEPDPVPGLVEMLQKAREAVSEREAAEPVALETFGGKPPPCLDLLASGKFTQSHGTFNRIALTLAGYAVAAGMSEVDFAKWTNPLAIEFKASRTYDSVPARVKHLRTEYRYVKSEPRYQRFSCTFVRALQIPELGQSCAQCEVSHAQQKIRHALDIALKAVDRVRAGDPGAPFEAEVIGALRLLHDRAPAEWQRIRAQLKNLGVRMRDLEKVLRERGRQEGSKSDREPQDGLPEICADEGDLAELAEQAWQAIQKSNNPPHLFQRGGDMVRILRGDDGAPYLGTVSEAGLRGILARCAKWYTVNPNGERKPARPPLDVVRDMQAAPEMPLPTLARLVHAPFFAPAGELICRPGYHPDARVYYQPPPNVSIPPVSATPSHDEVLRALSLLLDDLLGDFPFVDPASRAHTLGAILLPYVRLMVDGPTPLHLIDAPRAGTGKGLLADVICLQATGRSAEVMTEADDEEEWRKRITATLMRAPVYLLIDNVRNFLDSGQLSAALTATTWADRQLGASKVLVLPNMAVWLATGNNVTVSNELARRAVWVRLDAGVERPWLRTGFRHPDLRLWAREHRGELVWAALTLCQAWVAEGMPRGSAMLGSFESWAAVIGGILEVAGLPGFLGNATELYATVDEEAGEWREFIHAWWERYRASAVGVEDLFRLAREKDLLPSVLGDQGERSQRTRLGKALGRRRDQIIASYRIESPAEDRCGRRIYRLIPAPSTTKPGGAEGTADVADVCRRRAEVPGSTSAPEKPTAATVSAQAQTFADVCRSPALSETTFIGTGITNISAEEQERLAKTSAHVCTRSETLLPQGFEGADIAADVSADVCRRLPPGDGSTGKAPAAEPEPAVAHSLCGNHPLNPTGADTERVVVEL